MIGAVSTFVLGVKIYLCFPTFLPKSREGGNNFKINLNNSRNLMFVFISTEVLTVTVANGIRSDILCKQEKTGKLKKYFWDVDIN